MQSLQASPPTDAVQPDYRSLVEEAIQAMRPMIRADGGDLALVSIEGLVVRVRLEGSCCHCAHAAQTLGTLRRKIMTASGIAFRVLPAPAD